MLDQLPLNKQALHTKGGVEIVLLDKHKRAPPSFSVLWHISPLVMLFSHPNTSTTAFHRQSVHIILFFPPSKNLIINQTQPTAQVWPFSRSYYYLGCWPCWAAGINERADAPLINAHAAVCVTCPSAVTSGDVLFPLGRRRHVVDGT